MSFSGPLKAAMSRGTPPVNSLKRAGWRELASWWLRRRSLVRVRGRSMLPVLSPDDEVLIRPCRSYRVGDIIVARHPFRTDVQLIKRLARFDGQGRVWLEGLNAEESSDSRTLGAVTPDLILGRVTSLLKTD
jgi:nickel-type superoxide dismutase maturation protease